LVELVWPEKAQALGQVLKDMGDGRMTKQVQSNDQPHNRQGRQAAMPGPNRAIFCQYRLDLCWRNHLLKHIE
jgi:hypothetical protein